ncbi:putative membrane protein YdjX (TVP38/TMEM64 family) [Paenibacillus endophyticus]|uniref:TVP38/TMEM64 family membrane protein n=1 Tax=Paenibacillus endophyticus TaxID=1294268 RepID=A0A7W5GCR8_9BACL|nr:TVP38/TMEM64 family protein [Paenibacillus endophyticus]MBB3155140.1 putative membrane protein YdjX (TVP38/TMEM64 family) [Paenibacillus endophyticus]
MLKIGMVVLLYASLIAAFLANQELLFTWLAQGGIENLPWMIGTAIVTAAIPFFPFGLIAAIIGAQYGPIWGSLINVISSTIAAALTFWAVRRLLQNGGRSFIAKSKRMDRFMLFFERNAFMAVFMARLIPFVPAQAVNAASAISQMPIGSFVLATLIGKIPVMFVFAFMGDQIFSSLSNVLITGCIYLLFLFMVYICFRWRKHAS